MDESWVKCSVVVEKADDEKALELLWGISGACGSEEKDLGDCLQIDFYYRHEPANIPLIEGLIGKPGPFRSLDLSVQPKENWMTPFRKFFQPLIVASQIRVLPFDEERSFEPQPGLLDILIDPGLGFGTGYHETTRLCLDALIEDRGKYDRLLDVGTGSGILCIAAVKLGCREAVGLDIDEDALGNARRNLALNDVAANVVLSSSALALSCDHYDRVVANIIAADLLPLLDGLQNAVAKGGILILSGLQEKDLPDLFSMIDSRRFSLLDRRAAGEWLRVRLERI